MSSLQDEVLKDLEECMGVGWLLIRKGRRIDYYDNFGDAIPMPHADRCLFLCHSVVIITSLNFHDQYPNLNI